MSIDAVITRVERQDGKTVLHLESRWDRDNEGRVGESIAGQRTLTIEGDDPYARPAMSVWGSASSVELVRPGLEAVTYARIGYSRLAPGCLNGKGESND